MKSLRIIIAALVLLAPASGMAPAETYVEGYIGSNFTVTAPNPLELDVNPAYRGPTKVRLEYPTTVSSAVIGGAKLGTWFSKQGFPGFDYPDWMKYLGCYLDFNIHGLDYYREIGSRRMDITPSPPFLHFQHYKFLGHGNLITLGFMFAFRYGFFPREKVPFGKFQPYVAVGPALLITSYEPTLMFQPNNNYELFPVYNIPREFTSSTRTHVSLGLATELGLRYMLTRFLSVETSCKYRYARPSLAYDLEIDGFTHHFRFAPQFNLFSIQVGVAYHF